MLEAMDLPGLGAIGPELWLSIGALVLLMTGVFGGRGANTLVTGMAIATGQTRHMTRATVSTRPPINGMTV